MSAGGRARKEKIKKKQTTIKSLLQRSHQKIVQLFQQWGKKGWGVDYFIYKVGNYGNWSKKKTSLQNRL